MECRRGRFIVRRPLSMKWYAGHGPVSVSCAPARAQVSASSRAAAVNRSRSFDGTRNAASRSGGVIAEGASSRRRASFATRIQPLEGRDRSLGGSHLRGSHFITRASPGGEKLGAGRRTAPGGGAGGPGLDRGADANAPLLRAGDSLHRRFERTASRGNVPNGTFSCREHCEELEGMTVSPGRCAKCSTTASWARPMRPTCSRSPRIDSSGRGPYTSRGTAAATSHNEGETAMTSGRVAPGSPSGASPARRLPRRTHYAVQIRRCLHAS